MPTEWPDSIMTNFSLVDDKCAAAAKPIGPAPIIAIGKVDDSCFKDGSQQFVKIVKVILLVVI